MKSVVLAISVILSTAPLHAERKSLKINPIGIAAIAGGGAVFYQARYQHRRFIDSKERMMQGKINFHAFTKHGLLSLAFAGIGVTSTLWGASIMLDVSQDTKRVEIGWRFD